MANWLQRSVARLAGIDMTERDPGDGRWWGASSVQTMSGQTVTSESALQLDVVQSVLTRLAGTVSTLPLMVFERMPDGSRKPATDHPLYKLLHGDPGDRKTSQEFRDEQQMHLGFYRNCYTQIMPANGNAIGELHVIHPLRVQRVQKSDDGYVYYSVRRLDNSGIDVFREDEIWHIRKAPLTIDGLMGRPMWDTGRETFGRAQAVEQFGSLYFANGGSGGGTLEHPGNFRNKEDQDIFLEAWRSGGTGINRHRDRLLLNGVKYSQLQINNEQGQFLETLKEVGYKICRLWNMPPHLAGMLDKATFSNIEQQSIEYVVHTLAPWITAWEEAAHRDLLLGDDRDNYFVEFNVAGLLRGDFKTRWDSYAKGRQWGWLSVNDIRRLENMEPIAKGGDEYLVPLNMSPSGRPGGDGTEEDPQSNNDATDPADTPEDQGGQSAPR